MNPAHIDAPEMTKWTRFLWYAVKKKADPEFIKYILRNKIDLVQFIRTAPCYKQPNGFWTFKMGDLYGTSDKGNGDNLIRLHYWPTKFELAPHKPQDALGGVHDHMFHLTSLVLAGGPLLNAVFQPKEDDTKPELGTYKITYVDPKRNLGKLVKQGIDLGLPDLENVPVNHYYHLKSGVFHASRIVADRSSFTLMVTERDHSMDGPTCIFKTEFGPELEFNRIMLSAADRELVVSEALRLLL